MENLTQHLSHQSQLLIILTITLLIIVLSVPYFINQHKRYGSYFDFASPMRKRIAGVSFLVLTGLIIYGFTPYVAPPTDEVALILGNTQNTPYPAISGDISNAIESTMLQHKGDDVSELVDSIKIISAVKQPAVINLEDSGVKLKEIRNNSSNADRSARINIAAIEDKLSELYPTDNGANYLEAILKARDNVKKGSKIIVIGSGLSDTGDLNFSKSNILTNEQNRKDIIEKIQNKYGTNYLDEYSIEFYGLGDSTLPQEALASKQKEIVRNIYKDTIRSLGGDATINTKTLVGESVKTNFVVGTTDTGCGDIGLIFDDENLKFVSDQATFTDTLAAKNTLMTIKNLWDKYSDTIQSIQIDGYIAHYQGQDNLSQKRADLVRNSLVDLGIPSNKLNPTGKGFGPYKLDPQNRMVKITISRNSDLCKD